MTDGFIGGVRSGGPGGDGVRFGCGSITCWAKGVTSESGTAEFIKVGPRSP